MKRFNRNSPFSLFSFQDIITGLCGIIILFVLIMLVDLVMRRDASSSGARDEPVEVVDRTDELRNEIATLKQELAAVRELARSVIVATKDKAAPEVAKANGSSLGPWPRGGRSPRKKHDRNHSRASVSVAQSCGPFISPGAP